VAADALEPKSAGDAADNNRAMMRSEGKVFIVCHFRV
jgi:hypothetical protein